MGISLLAITNFIQTASANGDFNSPQGFIKTPSTTESNRQLVVGVAGTIGGAMAPTTVNANATGTGRSIVSRKNSANGNISVAPTDSTSGYYQDTTNSDAVAQGDKFCFEFLSTGTPTYTFLTTGFQASGAHAALYCADCGFAITSATMRFAKISGAVAASVGGEANCNITARAAVTYQYATAYISANAVAATSTIVFRKNTANGNQSISIGSSATGFFTDSTNTDSVVAGDLLCWGILPGNASSMTINTISCTAVNSTLQNNDVFCAANAGGATATTSQIYSPIIGNGVGIWTTTESFCNIRHGFAVTVSNLRVSVTTNPIAANSVFVSRKNGANGNQTITVGSTATGKFEDTTHSDTLSANDDYCIALTPGSASGMQVSIISVTETGPVPWSASATFAGSDTLKVSAAVALSATTTFGGTGSLSAVVTQGVVGFATFAGGGSLSVSTIETIQEAATFGGAGGLSISTIETIQEAATFNGAGSLSIATTQGLAALATFNGAGNLSANVTRQGVAAFAAFAGAGNLAATAAVAWRSRATFTGAGSLAINAFIGSANSALFSGSGGLSAAASLALIGAAQFGGAGSLSALVSLGLFDQATFKGAGSLSVGTLLVQAHVWMGNGAGSLSVSVAAAVAAFASLQGAGSLAVDTIHYQQATAMLIGTGAMIVSTDMGLAVSAVFNGAGHMCINAAVRLGPKGPTSNTVVVGPGPTTNLVTYGAP